MAGITTDEIDLYVRSEPSLLANYCGVYAIDQLIDEFVKCAQKITTKAGRAKLPFAIVNTDPIDKSGTHWISLVKLQDESFFMFDSFGLLGFSEFIASDDRKLTSTFLTRFETYEQGNFKYYSFVFDVEAFLSLTKKQRKSLSDTCLGLMLFLTAFAVSAGHQQDKYLRIGRSDTVAFHIDLRRIRTLFPEQDLFERFQDYLSGQDLHRVHDKGRDSQKFPKRRQNAGGPHTQRIRHKVVHRKERHRG